MHAVKDSLATPSPLICEELETVCETRRTRASFTSKLLKKSASGVLAALRGSTYRTEYASPLRLLRPCWTAFLNSLLETLADLKMVGRSLFHFDDNGESADDEGHRAEDADGAGT